MNKRENSDWDLFVNPATGGICYCDLCGNCVRQCKQSFVVQVVLCQRYKGRCAEAEAQDPMKEGRKGNG